MLCVAHLFYFICVVRLARRILRASHLDKRILEFPFEFEIFVDKIGKRYLRLDSGNLLLVWCGGLFKFGGFTFICEACNVDKEMVASIGFKGGGELPSPSPN